MQGSTQSSDFPVAHEFRIRSRRMVKLGPVRVELRSNEPEFAGFRYFPQTLDLTAGDSSLERAADYTLNLCNLGIDGPWPLDEIRRVQDSTYRAKRFSSGYYLTDHFGSPSYIVSFGSRFWIFSEDFERILWPYAIKWVLTRYSIEHHALHLKCAAVAINGEGTLLVARGTGGKTVLMTQLCHAGAHFLSNTHSLIYNTQILGIATAMRVRRDALFGPIIAQNHSAAAVKPDEFLLDPAADLGWQRCTAAPVRNICIVDYRGPTYHMIRRARPSDVFDYMDQFSLALNVYGLKDDILDFFGKRCSTIRSGDSIDASEPWPIL